MCRFKIVFGVLLLGGAVAFGQLHMENLDRGAVAVRHADRTFVSWRMLKSDPANIGFELYRSVNGGEPVLVAETPITGRFNFTDLGTDANAELRYAVRAVIVDAEGRVVNEQPDIPAPAGSCIADNPLGEPCHVVSLRLGAPIHFVWVGDLNGDGAFDYVVDRINTESPGTGLEAYLADGTFLWKLDNGPGSANLNNISPGPATLDVGHWDGATVGDVTGNGRAEVICKIANGTVLGDGTVWDGSGNLDDQWLTVLDGRTGKLISAAEFPETYGSVGPLACHVGIGSGGIFANMKNRNRDKSFNMMVCSYRMNGGRLKLEWCWTRADERDEFSEGHNIRVVDLDGDGVDDYANIGFALNGVDGSVMYNLYESDDVVHGDRFQIGKFDPSRPGLQGYGVQQRQGDGLLEYYYDAITGEVLWKHFADEPGADVGRGNAGDLDPDHAGYEVWSFSGMYNGPDNEPLTDPGQNPYPNFRIWWDGDNGSESYNDKKFEQWNSDTKGVERLLTTWKCQSATGSARGAPMFYGDIFGDWREEVVLTNPQFDALVIFTTDIPTEIGRPSLAQDPYYRACMTVKGYMQSHHTSFYLGFPVGNPPKLNKSCVVVRERVKTDHVKVAEGTDVALLPSADRDGTWAWIGPNGFTAARREAVFSGITKDKAGLYRVLFADSSGNTVFEEL